VKVHKSTKMIRTLHSDSSFPILVLDGGGSKGVYTLGVLQELEDNLDKPLHEHFKLIYGTSTGAIIAALLGIGMPVRDIKAFYFEHIPNIMGQPSKSLKSKELARLCDQVFENKTFDDFKTNVGIVAVNYTENKPLIFKTNMNQVHSSNPSFKAGFGCRISDAIQASCSAYPIFNKKIIHSNYHGTITAIDGGFLAKNATLYALIDADKTLKVPKENMDVLSLGTGNYTEKPMGGIVGLIMYLDCLKFVMNLICSNNNANEQLLNILFEGVKITRINKTYKEERYATNMIERDVLKLGKLYQLGRQSFNSSSFVNSINQNSYPQQQQLQVG
jgi:patatin-like phospholipase/acyl hydrolase